VTTTASETIMSNVAAKLAYKPVGLLLGASAGMASGLIFKQVWKLAGHDDDAPNATDEDRGWVEILTAAALQGAIFAVVKAAVDRAGAVGVRKATGRWPG
jgi:predicted metal-dependent enzyme (double-stranded beta helix superfamily)